MNQNNKPCGGSCHEPNKDTNYEQLLAQLRQDQLEAALAGRIAESAFFAAEAQALRDEFAQENVLSA
jgi:hypothetical protein